MKPERYARVKEVYLQAVALPTEQRTAFLARTCGDDPPLRAEVESLLRHHDSETLLPAGTLATTRDRSRRIAAAPPGLTRLRATPRRTGLIVAAAVVLVLLGAWLHFTIRASLRNIAGAHLLALVDAEVLALEEWIEQRKSTTQTWAKHRVVTEATSALIDAVSGLPDDAPEIAATLRGQPSQSTLRGRFELEQQADDAAAFSLVDRRGQVLATNFDEVVGLRLNPAGMGLIAHVWQGETLFVGPHRDGAWLSVTPEVVHSRPLTWVFAPVRDGRGQVVAALGFGKFADLRFSELLAAARPGRTGETYAFDQEGRLLSESRFNGELRRVGLIEDTDGARSMLKVTLRDPGGNLVAGFRPSRDRDILPFTEPVAMALASRTKPPEQQRGVLTGGYRDYRGVPAIGAWRWLPAYRFGILGEMDLVEADAPLVALDRAVGVLLALLAASLAVSFAASFAALRWRHAADEARQLGPYTLLERIGEGGMGEVHLARHALLKRPTAIKLIHRDHVSPDAVARFEREAQMISQLTHPNTVEIYDFGRTADGVFYLAMEYLAGPTLADLVLQHGPVEPARAIHILRQIGGSLREAHELGVLHRDIKPQNVILSRRGGSSDVAKVLDFGLAKNLEGNTRELTSSQALIGTPMYMAPERLAPDGSAADARSDIFAFGAVGYFLLSGRHAFEGDSVVAIFQRILHDDPTPIAACNVPPELERLLIHCLAKRPEERPPTMADIVAALDELARRFPWNPPRQLPEDGDAAGRLRP